MNQALVFLLMVLATLIGAGGAFLVKKGSHEFTLSPARLIRNAPFISGGILYAASLVLYVFLLRYLPLSIAYPLTSMTYIWVALLSRQFLDEKVDAYRWAGIALIVAGIAVISL